MRKASHCCVSHIIVTAVDVIRYVKVSVDIHRCRWRLTDGIASNQNSLPNASGIGHVEEVVIDCIIVNNMWNVTIRYHDIDIIDTP